MLKMRMVRGTYTNREAAEFQPRSARRHMENLSASAQAKSSGQAALPSKVCSALCWFWLGQLQEMEPCFPGHG